MKTTQKPILSYDESDIIDGQVEYLTSDEGEYKGRDKSEIRELVYQDSDLFELEWNDFKNNLTDVLNEINKSEGYFKIKGLNMGWRHLEGFKILKAGDGEALLNGILPKTNQFSLDVWKSKTQIKIRCSHHDAPTGEYYFIKPLTKIELKKELENDY